MNFETGISKFTKSYVQGGARKVIQLIVHVTHFYYYKNI